MPSLTPLISLLLYLSFFSCVSTTLPPNLSLNLSSIPTSRPSATMSLAAVHSITEIEPPADKSKTIPDEDMPELPNLNVLGHKNEEDRISHWDDEKRTLWTDRYFAGMYQARQAIGNGYIGGQVAGPGPYFEYDVNQTNHNGIVQEGWPEGGRRATFWTVAGFFDVQPKTERTNFPELLSLGSESIISGLPYSLAIVPEFCGKTLNSTVDPSTISNYWRGKSLENGTYSWRYTWSPCEKGSFEIEQTTIADRSNPHVAATEVRITQRRGSTIVNGTMMDLIDGRSARRSQLLAGGMLPGSQIFVNVHPNGLPDVHGWTVSTADFDPRYIDESSRRMVNTTSGENDNDMTIAQAWDVHLHEGETAVFKKFIGTAASSDSIRDPRAIAFDASTRAAKKGWESTLSGHIKATNALMAPNLIADYRDPATGKIPRPSGSYFIEVLQIDAFVSRDMIFMNLIPEDESGLNDAGLSPVGLHSDGYAGMVFWDQETWILPAVALTNPEYGLQMLKYRRKLLTQAKANAQMDYVKKFYNFAKDAVLYPWTSGRYGNATATGPAVNYESHLNADIAQANIQFFRITGNETDFKLNGWPLVKGVGYTASELLKKDGEGYSILNITDPDEYAAGVDNGAFSLAAFAKTLQDIVKLQERFGEEVNSTWEDMSQNVNIPKAPSGITQEYIGMKNNVVVKQADVQLLTHPLRWTNSYTLEDVRRDLAFYTQKQTPDGPAMTASINSIVELQTSQLGCAGVTYHQMATIPFLRSPWYQMSETANDDVNGNGGVPPASPFLTGHGGNLQVPIFGYFGLDIADERGLSLNPTLQWLPHLRVPDFYYQGANFEAVMNRTHTVLTRLPSRNTSVIQDVYSDRPMPIYTGSRGGRMNTRLEGNLSVGESITMRNDMSWTKLRTPRNILQCQDATSMWKWVSGKWPQATADGNPATTWQSLTTDPTIVQFDTRAAPRQEIEKVNLDFGARPPVSIRLGFSNSSNVTSFDDASLTVVDLKGFVVNAPRKQGPEVLPVPYVGNTTEYVFTDRVVMADFTYLEVAGCDSCGSRNSWTGGDATSFHSDEDTFGASIGEVELVGVVGTGLRDRDGFEVCVEYEGVVVVDATDGANVSSGGVNSTSGEVNPTYAGVNLTSSGLAMSSDGMRVSAIGGLMVLSALVVVGVFV